MTRSARASSSRFDWTVTVLCAVFLGGVFLDGWAHTHGRVDDTFFTPWHAALYAGFLATAVFLWANAVWAIRRGSPWRTALPRGYGLALLGVLLWLVGGPFDAGWHAVFGFEAGVEALLSPAHALLAFGFGLMASGPLRAALDRAPGSWHREVPMVLSLTFVVSVLTFFTQIAHPLANLWAARGANGNSAATELGIVGMIVTTAIVVGPALLLLRQDRLPAGGFSMLVGINSVAMGFLYDQGPYPRAAVIALVVAGVAVDVLRAVLRPSIARPVAFRVFAFVTPTILQFAYFASLHATVGIAWSSHLWIGAIVFAGVVGWLLSYLVHPSRAMASVPSPEAPRFAA